MTHFDGGKFTLDSREVLATNGLIAGEMQHLFAEMFAGRGLEHDPDAGGICGEKESGEVGWRYSTQLHVPQNDRAWDRSCRCGFSCSPFYCLRLGFSL